MKDRAFFEYLESKGEVLTSWLDLSGIGNMYRAYYEIVYYKGSFFELYDNGWGDKYVEEISERCAIRKVLDCEGLEKGLEVLRDVGIELDENDLDRIFMR